MPLCPSCRDAVVLNAPPTPPQPLVYYLTRVDKSGLVKIGTTRNLRDRMNALGARGRTVTLLATEPGDAAVERKRHIEFGYLRTEGEWFRLAAPLAAHIQALASQ